MYSGVGTDVGIANKQRQGTGLATVLQGGTADDYFLRYAEKMAAKREEKLAQRDAQRAGALQKLSSLNPDFFYAHQQEKAEALKKVQELGMAAISGDENTPGVANPWEGTDARSIEFQRAATELQNMASVSQQVQEFHKEFQRDVQAKGANYFDPRSLTGMHDYLFGRGLKDHMANPSSVPLVTQRQPLANLTDFASGLAGKINGSLNGNAYDPKMGREAVRAAFLNPDPNNNLAESATLALGAYSPTERAAIEKQAREYGISAPEMLATTIVEQFATKQKPFNVDEALGDAAKAFDVTYTKYEGTDTFSKRPDERATMQGANSAARAMLRSDPRALAEFSAMYGLKHDANETEAEFFAEVQRTVAKDLWTRKKKDRESGVFRDKADDQKLEQSTDLWLRDMKSGNYNVAQNAAGVLQNLGYLGNLKVSQAKVQNAGLMTDKGDLQNGAAGNLLVLELETPTTVKMTKEEVGGQIGAKEDSFEIEQGAGKTTVTVSLDKLDPNDQLLRSMYQRAAKQNGVLYEETWKPPSTLDETFPSAQTTPAPTPASNKKIYNF